MKSLSKSDRYAIEFLYSQQKTEKDIAKELGCTIAQVKRVVNELSSPKADNKPISETKTDKTKNLMIRQTSAKKNNSVSIMTEGAAQLADEFIKNLPTNSKNTDSYIYRRPE